MLRATSRLLLQAAAAALKAVAQEGGSGKQGWEGGQGKCDSLSEEEEEEEEEKEEEKIQERRRRRIIFGIDFINTTSEIWF
jgi:ribosomal protein L12E/L44/L45/RPP1/RPP2